MSTNDFRLDLTRPLLGGTYMVDGDALRRLAAEAARADLHVCRIDLTGCEDKSALLQMFAAALRLPADFGHNWDALADLLRDLSWLPGWGHVLLVDHADVFELAAPADFAILLGVLDDAATFAVDRDQPFFAFLSTPALLPEPPHD